MDIPEEDEGAVRADGSGRGHDGETLQAEANRRGVCHTVR